MNINMSSIMSKVDAWSKSPEGQRRMKACIDKYKKEGRSTTAVGDKIVTEKMIWEAASKFIAVLRSAASSYDLPDSIIKHFDSLECSRPIHLHDGSTVIYVYFGDDLHRDSLEDGSGYYGGKFGGYTGEGINNIIALFNNGANAKEFVYGWWNDHSPTGSAFAHSLPGDDFAWVRSKKGREPLRFIQQAINDFNDNYGADYGVSASAGSDYQ